MAQYAKKACQDNDKRVHVKIDSQISRGKAFREVQKERQTAIGRPKRPEDIGRADIARADTGKIDLFNTRNDPTERYGANKVGGDEDYCYFHLMHNR